MATTSELVTDRFTATASYAATMFNTATEFLDDIAEEQSAIVLPTMDIAYDFDEPLISTDITASRPTAPSEEDLAIDDIDSPTMLSLEDVTIPSIGSIPILTASPPGISYPDVPDDTMPSSPGTAPVISDYDMPASASYVEPTAPTLSTISIPLMPSISTPSFDGEMPAYALESPDTSFTYAESAYSSDLLTSLSAKLKDLVDNGGTGLGATTENALWQRGTDRLNTEYSRRRNEVYNRFSSRGFTLPTGALNAALAEVDTDYARQMEQLNYEIAIEQARLAQHMSEVALTAASSLEGQLMSMTSAIAQRTLEAAKYSVEAAIRLFEAATAAFNTRLEAYKAAAAVYEAKTRAAMITLEAYKAQLEALQITQQTNVTAIQLYQAQWQAAETQIGLYRSQLEAVNLQSQIDRTKLDAFKTKVDAYQAGINAVTSKFNLYQAQLGAEETKVKVYSAQVGAYGTQVQAYETQARAQKTITDAQVSSNENKLRIYQSDIEMYKAQLALNTAQVDAVIKAHASDVDAYKAEIGLVDTDLKAKVAYLNAKVDEAKNKSQVLLGEYDASVKAYLGLKELNLKSLETGGHIAAQIAASAMTAAHASASLGASYSETNNLDV